MVRDSERASMGHQNISHLQQHEWVHYGYLDWWALAWCGVKVQSKWDKAIRLTNKGGSCCRENLVQLLHLRGAILASGLLLL
jgi:hypothetical protein